MWSVQQGFWNRSMCLLSSILFSRDEVRVLLMYGDDLLSFHYMAIFVCREFSVTDEVRRRVGMEKKERWSGWCSTFWAMAGGWITWVRDPQWIFKIQMVKVSTEIGTELLSRPLLFPLLLRNDGFGNKESGILVLLLSWQMWLTMISGRTFWAPDICELEIDDCKELWNFPKKGWKAWICSLDQN